VNIIDPIQTEEFNVEQVRLSDDHPLLVVFDLSGSPSFRTRWRQFYQGTEGTDGDYLKVFDFLYLNYSFFVKNYTKTEVLSLNCIFFN